MKNNLRKRSGITLIALVITIIVLLILAGVSIATLTGENGILTQASSAKKQTEIAEAKERAKLDILEWTTNQIRENKPTTLDEATIQDILSKSQTKGQYIKGEPGEKSFLTLSGYEILYSELDNSIDEETATLEAGLYDENGVRTYTWEELISTEITYTDVYNGEMSSTILCNNSQSIGTNYAMDEELSEFNASSDYLVGKLVIDNSVTNIDSSGFYLCKKLTEVVLSNQITTISDGAFVYCSNLSSITLYDVDEIKAMAFGCCTSLSEINYNGTKEQWNSITFSERWNEECPEITVHCADGDIVVPAWEE